MPRRIEVTGGMSTGDADEKAVLQRTLQAEHCYVMDRGYVGYQLFNAIDAIGSSYYFEHKILN